MRTSYIIRYSYEIINIVLGEKILFFFLVYTFFRTALKYFCYEHCTHTKYLTNIFLVHKKCKRIQTLNAF